MSVEPTPETPSAEESHKYAQYCLSIGRPFTPETPPAPKGYALVKPVNSQTTNAGDLVWNKDKREWEPVDSVNEYVSEYIAVCRETPEAEGDELLREIKELQWTPEKLVAEVKRLLAERDSWKAEAAGYKDDFEQMKAERDQLQRELGELKAAYQQRAVYHDEVADAFREKLDRLRAENTELRAALVEISTAVEWPDAEGRPVVSSAWKAFAARAALTKHATPKQS